MNRVILMGRLTREPDIRQPNETKVARFGLAVDRRFPKEGEKDADFPSCVAFGKSADFVEKYLHKGTKIVVEGHIQTGGYTNKDGQKIFTTDVICESFEFAESKKNDSDGGNSSGGNQKKAEPKDDGFMNVPEGLDAELPFV